MILLHNFTKFVAVFTGKQLDFNRVIFEYKCQLFLFFLHIYEYLLPIIKDRQKRKQRNNVKRPHREKLHF